KKSLTLSEEKQDLDLHELNMEATTITRRTGKPAPAWTVTAARGAKKDVKLSDFKGKWVLIVLWSAGALTTNNFELPSLIDVCESRSKDRDKFEIIAFHDSAVHGPSVKNFEQLDEKLKSAKEWYWRGRDLPFPVLLDSTGKTMKDFGIPGLPMMILIDPEGKVVGLARQEELEAKL